VPEAVVLIFLLEELPVSCYHGSTLRFSYAAVTLCTDGVEIMLNGVINRLSPRPIHQPKCTKPQCRIWQACAKNRLL